MIHSVAILKLMVLRHVMSVFMSSGATKCTPMLCMALFQYGCQRELLLKNEDFVFT